MYSRATTSWGALCATVLFVNANPVMRGLQTCMSAAIGLCQCGAQFGLVMFCCGLLCRMLCVQLMV